MKIVLVVPDGVGVRNFLCSDFATLATAEGELVVWHQLPAEAIAEHRERLGPDVRWCELDRRREPLAARVLRSGKFLSQVERFPEPGARPLLVNRYETMIGRWVHRGGRVLAKFLALVPAALATVERLHGRAALGNPRDNPWQAFLRREAPDIVFCTHQRASVAVPPVAAARRLGIPTASFIYSWDNLPKGRMAVWPGHYLVWSEKMANDLRHYYPETTDDQVHIVGTPQFEAYADRALRRDRDGFCQAIGLDPARPIVLFSGDDASTSPFDPGYLADLAAALAALGPDAPQLLFRRSPADLTDRYRTVLDAHPEIAVLEPAWSAVGGEGWQQVVPSIADRELLVNLVHHCALVVNLGSTMALDFALADKPAIYLCYEQPDPYGVREWNAARIYRLPHFESVHQTQPVLWARSTTDLGVLVQQAIADPAALAAARRAWIDIEIARPIEEASRRCIESLREIAAVGAP